MSMEQMLLKSSLVRLRRKQYGWNEHDYNTRYFLTEKYNTYLHVQILYMNYKQNILYRI